MTNPQDVVKQVRKYTRKKFIPDEKIRIVLEGLRGEVPITDLCRREGIASAVYYKWSKEFLEAGKNGLTRASLRNATTDEVKNLKDENNDLKRAVAELILNIMKYKKSLGM
jgi:transposase